MTIYHSIASQIHLSKLHLKKKKTSYLKRFLIKSLAYKQLVFYLEVNIWWIWCVITNWRIKRIFNKEAIGGLSGINRN